MNGDSKPTPNQVEPEFTRLVLIITGSLSAALTPYWAGWLRVAHPELQVRTVVTPSALQFVTCTALAASTGGPVVIDRWPADQPEPSALHVELAEWAQVFLVYPSCWHFTARLALGLADSPSLLALHCTKAPVLVAPSVPPGSLDSPVFQKHLRALRARAGYQVAPLRLGRSVTTGRHDALVPDHFPDLVGALSAMHYGSSSPNGAAVVPGETTLPVGLVPA